MQTILRTSDNYRILIIPLDTSLPKPVEINNDIPEDPSEEKSKIKAALMSSREEILTQVEKDTPLNSNFILLIVLSAIVASIGLLENNVAVIIGAMVIAPPPGSNIAFSSGTSLGEKDLVIKALKAMAVGVILAIVTATLLRLVWPSDLYSRESMLRTDVAYSGTDIALASGSAASLSLVTSASSILVGV